MALELGLIDCALCVAAFKNSSFTRVGTTGAQRLLRGHARGRRARTPRRRAVGLAAPVAGAAMATRRYLHRYGVDREKLAAVALAQRRAARAQPARRDARAADARRTTSARASIVEPLRLLRLLGSRSTPPSRVILTRADRAAHLRAPGRARPRLPGPPRRAERVHLRPARASASTRPRCSTTQPLGAARAGLPPRRRHARGDPDAALLRRLLAADPLDARALRLLRARRGRRLDRRRAHRARRRAAGQHQRRPPLGGPLQRLGPDARDRPPAARRRRGRARSRTSRWRSGRRRSATRSSMAREPA